MKQKKITRQPERRGRVCPSHMLSTKGYTYIINYLETHPGLSNQVNDPLLPATGLDVDVTSGFMWDGRVSIYTD